MGGLSVPNKAKVTLNVSSTEAAIGQAEESEITVAA